MVNYPFDTSLRLLDASAYKAVFDDAQIKVSNQHLLMLARQNSFTHPRLGLVIAKKNVRLATQRNRVKRIIRESFRLRQHQLAPVDVIVLARRGLQQFSHAELHQMFDQLWRQLQKKAVRKINDNQPLANS